ncbi:MAG: hypothetical protein Q9167_001418 [Letrouitia subvulpina]
MDYKRIKRARFREEARDAEEALQRAVAARRWAEEEWRRRPSRENTDVLKEHDNHVSKIRDFFSRARVRAARGPTHGAPSAARRKERRAKERLERERVAKEAEVLSLEQSHAAEADQGHAAEVEHGFVAQADQGFVAEVEQGTVAQADQGHTAEVDEGFEINQDWISMIPDVPVKWLTSNALEGDSEVAASTSHLVEGNQEPTKPFSSDLGSNANPIEIDNATIETNPDQSFQIQVQANKEIEEGLKKKFEGLLAEQDATAMMVNDLKLRLEQQNGEIITSSRRIPLGEKEVMSLIPGE